MAGRVVTIQRQQGGQNITVDAVGGLAAKRPVFTQEGLQNRQVQVRQMNELVRFVIDMTKTAQANPLNSAVIIQNVAMTGGVTYQIPHSLGRAYTGWLVTRAQTAAWAGYETALATGLTADRYIALVTSTTGTFDFIMY